MIVIDGSLGEGGGQIVRSALTLSLLTGKPFRIKNARGGRKTPGLLRQHLTAINACAAICNGKVSGATMNAREFSFEPQVTQGGEYHFAVGSAGSTMLVLQTILLPLLSASTPSLVLIEGGTHNPLAPPFDFIERSFLPILSSIGASVHMKLERPGFYPAGGGKIAVEITPSTPTNNLVLLSSGALIRREARALVAGLPGEIAKRELSIIKQKLDWDDIDLKIVQLPHEYGPGNVVLTLLEYENISSIFCAFGERGLRAEAVAESVVKNTQEFLTHGVPVSPHLADQLLLPCIWAGGGEFMTYSPTQHFYSNLELAKQFVEMECSVDAESMDATRFKLRCSH